MTVMTVITRSTRLLLGTFKRLFQLNSIFICLLFLAFVSGACTKKKVPVIPENTDVGGGTPTSTTIPFELPYDPQLRLVINSGAPFTSSVNVQLKIETTTPPEEMYLTNTPGCKADGDWESFKASRAWNLKDTNALNVVFIKVRRSGFESQCASAEIQHDSLPPETPMLSINNGSRLTTSQQVILSLSAAGATEMRVSNIPGCQQAPWEPFSNLKNWFLAQQNSLAIVYAQFRDQVGNESPCVWSEITHDSIPPTVSIIQPVENFVVNKVSQSQVDIAGTCEDSTSVQIKGAVSAQALCVGHQFFWRADLTGKADGVFSITAQQIDTAGNLSSIVTRNFLMNTSPPTNLSLMIENGASYTAASKASINVSATDGAEVWLSNQSDCEYGVWETIAPNLEWNLLGVNQRVFVYAKFRDAYQNESACIGSSILQDSLPPDWNSSVTHAATSSSLTESPLVSVILNATDSLSGFDRYERAIGTAPGADDVFAWQVFNQSPFVLKGLSLTEGTTYFVNVRTFDKAGNFKETSSPGWLVDQTPPQVRFTQIPATTETDYDVKIVGTCEEGLAVQLLYSSGLGGPSVADCMSGQFQAWVFHTGTAGARKITARQTDAGGQTGSASVNYNFVRKYFVGGPVYAKKTLKDGSKILIGNFSSVADQKDAGIVAFASDGSKSNSIFFSGGFNGPVRTTLPLPDGSFLVGGEFNSYRGRVANFIAKLSPSGELDESFNSQSAQNGFNGPVYAIAISNGSYLVGGGFSSYRGQPADRLIKLNSDGSVDNGFQASADGLVRALQIQGNALFVGGDFSNISGRSASRIAKLSPVSGAFDVNFYPDNSSGFVGARVNSLASDASALYVGGEFTSYRGQVANRIVKINLVDGSLDTVFSPVGSNGANAEVLAVVQSSGQIYIGGRFSSYRGLGASKLARLNSSGVLDSQFSPAGTNDIRGFVGAILVDGTKIFIGGEFVSYRGARAENLAKLDSSGKLDAGFNPSTGPNGTAGSVVSLAKLGSLYLATGNIVAYRPPTQIGNVAKIDSNGNLDSIFMSGNSGFNALARAIWVDPGQTFALIGGDFTKYRGASVNRLAKISLSTGALDSAFSSAGNRNGFNRSVHAVVADGTSVYVGGDFSRYRASRANFLAKLNLKNGNLDTTFNPDRAPNGTNASVYSLMMDGANVIAGGRFEIYRSSSSPRLMRFFPDGNMDTVFRNAMGEGIQNGEVRSLFLNAGDLYVGGSFSLYQKKPVGNVLKLNSINLQPDPLWLGLGFNSYVQALFASGKDLYVGGSFTQYRGSLAMGFAKLNPSAELDAACSQNRYLESGAVAPVVRSLDLGNTDLEISGDFINFRGRHLPFHTPLNCPGYIFLAGPHQ